MIIQNVRSSLVGIAKLNLFNSLCFAVGCLLSGQVGQKLVTLVQLVKSGPSGWKKIEVVGHKLAKSRWNVGQKMVEGWSRWWSIAEKMLQVGEVGDKLVMVKGWWKIGGVGEFGRGLVKLVKSWWKVGELVKLVKSWRSWWSWPGAGEVGENLVNWLIKLVKRWWKVGEKLVKSWWKVGEFGENWWSWWV